MSATSNPPSPFPEDDAPYPGTVTNQFLPESAGGLIQAVKEAVVMATRDALTDTSLDISDSEITVEYEYGMVVQRLPGVWIQFSVQELKRVGISHEIMTQTPAPDNDPSGPNWEPIQEWTFQGRITFTVVALTSLERDRISDILLMNLAFARPPMLVMKRPNQDTAQFKTLITSLAHNPFVSLTLNTDEIISGGQSMDRDVPWMEGELVYEDTYSIDLIGQFNIKFGHDGLFTLHRVDLVIEPNYNPGDWV